MFSKFAIFTAISLAISAIATTGGGGDNKCNTGPIQCCDQLYEPGNVNVANIESLIGVALGPITALTGTGCSPLRVIGVGGGAKCQQQPVCCEKNYSNSLVGVNCSPINVNV